MLLIFFIILTPFLVQSALKVNLPFVKKVSEITKDTKIKIAISKTQEIFLNDKPLKDITALETALKAMPTGKTELVQIQADKDLNYGLVIKVLGIAQKLGITKFELATQNISE